MLRNAGGMVKQKNRIMLSEMVKIEQPSELEDMISRVLGDGLEGLVLKKANGEYEPGKRHWLKIKKDSIYGGAMADTLDLVVLGSWYGTGKNKGKLSVFLMGCYDKRSEAWRTVAKAVEAPVALTSPIHTRVILEPPSNKSLAPNPFSHFFNMGVDGHGTHDVFEDMLVGGGSHDLYVSLEEVFTGVTKKRKITRNVLLTADGRSTLREEKILTIEVKPGWKEGTKIIFEKEGDQSPGKIPADIIFIIRDKPHPLFKRDGANLVYTAKIPLRDALRGTLVSVPTLTGQRVALNFNKETTKPQTTRRLQGYGLPYPKNPTRKGDIIVHFDIQFPFEFL
ncbi:heat shock protein 40 [Penaeus vannamei]|uniref:Heat shock protein 40 n=1 Tax=Penaeus vannamei TaxID=6689 RepID=A0A423U3Z8_PENVA|nr:heat shock protein 40 [Penaeus vannamei]